MTYTRIKYLLSTILLLFAYIVFFFFNDFIKSIPEWVYTAMWAIFVIDILVVMIPRFARHTPSGKHLGKYFKEREYNPQALLNYVKKMNVRALLTFALYIVLLMVVGYLYFTRVINRNHIFLLVITLNFIDYFSINTWCIFHKVFIRNRCCNTCRIYNWDHFLKFGPFIFIWEFRTLSLFFLGVLALIQWEVSYALYPERFIDISNENLTCTQCDIECRFNIK